MDQAGLVLLVVVRGSGGGVVDVVVEEEGGVEGDGDEEGGLPADRRRLPVLDEHLLPARRLVGGGTEPGEARPAAVGQGPLLPAIQRRRGPSRHGAVGSEQCLGRRHHPAGRPSLEIPVHRRAKAW